MSDPSAKDLMEVSQEVPQVGVLPEGSISELAVHALAEQAQTHTSMSEAINEVAPAPAPAPIPSSAPLLSSPPSVVPLPQMVTSVTSIGIAPSSDPVGESSSTAIVPVSPDDPKAKKARNRASGPKEPRSAKKRKGPEGDGDALMPEAGAAPVASSSSTSIVSVDSQNNELFLDPALAIPVIGDTQVKKGKWSKAEDAVLQAAILSFLRQHGIDEEYGMSQLFNGLKNPEFRGCWTTVAKALPHRSHEAIYEHARTRFEKPEEKGPWTPEDTAKLLDLVKVHGPKWATIAKELRRRRVSCRDKYREVSLTDRQTGRWTDVEADRLREIVRKMLGETVYQERWMPEKIPWDAVAKEMKTRDKYQCIAKWEKICRKQRKSGLPMGPETPALPPPVGEIAADGSSSSSSSTSTSSTSQSIVSLPTPSLFPLPQINTHWTLEHDQRMLEWLYHQGANDESEVLWADLSKQWDYKWTPNELRTKWLSLKKRNKDRNEERTMPELIHELLSEVTAMIDSGEPTHTPSRYKLSRKKSATSPGGALHTPPRGGIESLTSMMDPTLILPPMSVSPSQTIMMPHLMTTPHVIQTSPHHMPHHTHMHMTQPYPLAMHSSVAQSQPQIQQQPQPTSIALPSAQPAPVSPSQSVHVVPDTSQQQTQPTPDIHLLAHPTPVATAAQMFPQTSLPTTTISSENPSNSS
eukprot:TRINITY_DN4753_c0_g1_i5.p1 TRINITY_DN4753_c0_g1~~TRINITY_DN4753_c0_g1_i5.p1  ORF type:complete len:709 (+),score=158.10 TRINITY_DN4753_c0_g1_i5:51-2129(+)